MKLPLWGLLACLLLAAIARADDIEGAEDFQYLDRFPGSDIVTFKQVGKAELHDVILSSIDRINGKLRFKKSERVYGAHTRITYALPSGIGTREAFDTLAKQLTKGERFRCVGPNCGRSPFWANDVFEEAQLNGADASQFYLASEVKAAGATYWVALYVVERGNRQVLARLDVVTPVAVGSADARWQAFLLAFLDASATRAKLDTALFGRAAEALLGARRGETVLVVCHLYGDSEAATLLSESNACAEEVAKALAPRHSELNFHPVGVGPADVKPGVRPRVELVLRTRGGVSRTVQ